LAPDDFGAELNRLYEEYASSLVRYAISYCGDPDLARDAVQDCFLRYFEMRRAGSNVEQPKAWLVRVLRNHLIDRRRREQLEKETSAGAARELRALQASLNSDFGGDEGVARLWQRIEALVSPKELACLQMRAAGFSYTEIAEALGVHPGTVSVFLTRSREKTASVLEPQSVPPRTAAG
jgi:RNA polymerase sigma factor (sigma-70 family)